MNPIPGAARLLSPWGRQLFVLQDYLPMFLFPTSSSGCPAFWGSFSAAMLRMPCVSAICSSKSFLYLTSTAMPTQLPTTSPLSSHQGFHHSDSIASLARPPASDRTRQVGRVSHRLQSNSHTSSPLRLFLLLTALCQ